MKIDELDRQNLFRIYGQKDISNKSKTVTKKSGSEEDTADISAEAKEINRLVKETMEISETRADRIEELKEKIQSGEYKVSPEKLADALIKLMGED